MRSVLGIALIGFCRLEVISSLSLKQSEMMARMIEVDNEAERCVKFRAQNGDMRSKK